MKLSARNTIEGKIVSISMGPVSTDLVIETACGLQIGSSITTASAKALGLEVGKKAYAVIKASSVMVGVDD
jgi:molybdopterin-binding protein